MSQEPEEHSLTSDKVTGWTTLGLTHSTGRFFSLLLKIQTDSGSHTASLIHWALGVLFPGVKQQTMKLTTCLLLKVRLRKK